MLNIVLGAPSLYISPHITLETALWGRPHFHFLVQMQKLRLRDNYPIQFVGLGLGPCLHCSCLEHLSCTCDVDNVHEHRIAWVAKQVAKWYGWCDPNWISKNTHLQAQKSNCQHFISIYSGRWVGLELIFSHFSLFVCFSSFCTMSMHHLYKRVLTYPPHYEL